MLCCFQFTMEKTVDVMLQCVWRRQLTFCCSQFVVEKTVDIMLQSVCGGEDS